MVQIAKLEICILKRLRCLNPDTCNIVRWNGFFFDQDRICLTFDLMDLSLYTLLKERNFEGLTTTELRPVIAQLATALSHLRSIGLVHADLKPDNVMIVDRHQTPLRWFYAEDTREYRLENLDVLVYVMKEEIERTHQGLLVDLIKRMLHLDPDVRIKPLEVLHHPFFCITSSSSADPVTTMDDGPADLEVSTENTEETENTKNMLEDQLVDNGGHGQAVWSFFSRIKNTVQNYFSWNRQPVVNIPPQPP
ncbi:Homeodomain-interacting protein kinase 3 [Collichthys lucidus]|uniref:Homeodomain-interacting protein kinase 3 n=1 Tax=Collichthys lucidus TaxID=240159 RepID=A0A4U5VCG7_COLLU|nr:Homeodomain-interacting protein kinase 3 [Collichthys lucidus]